MGWIDTDDGRKRCEEHGTVFPRIYACAQCSAAPLPAVVVDPPGEFELLTEEAARRQLPTRLEVESLLVSHGQVADARSSLLAGKAAAALEGKEPDHRAAALLFNAAVKWHEAASKTWRGLEKMVALRERRADAERHERMKRARDQARQRSARGEN
jgi:hypothetical protein